VTARVGGERKSYTRSRMSQPPVRHCTVTAWYCAANTFVAAPSIVSEPCAVIVTAFAVPSIFLNRINVSPLDILAGNVTGNGPAVASQRKRAFSSFSPLLSVVAIVSVRLDGLLGMACRTFWNWRTRTATKSFPAVLSGNGINVNGCLLKGSHVTHWKR
jgi:hypothetical protein